MSQEEQDVLVGKTARQVKEANEKISKLKVKAFSWGSVLHGLGVTLAQYPELLSFDEESMDAISSVLTFGTKFCVSRHVPRNCK